MSLPFENKIVLVTGGASGIGLATAVAFARESPEPAADSLVEDVYA